MQQMIVGMMFVVVILFGMVGMNMYAKKNKTKWEGKSFNLVLTALLVAISIILSYLRVYIPVFGFPAVRFSLSEVPIFLTGALLGGVYGAMAGFASDMISFMLTSPGAYHPGFTLNLILIGFIPGVIFQLIRSKKVRIPFAILNRVLVGIALIGALIYINGMGLKELKEVGKIGPFPVNVVLSMMMILLVIGLVAIVSKVKKTYSGDEGIYSIEQLIFAMCMNYIIVNLLLTPIWILQLYNVPIVASIAVRIFKSLIDVPLQIIAIYTVLHAIPVRMREKLL